MSASSRKVHTRRSQQKPTRTRGFANQGKHREGHEPLRLRLLEGALGHHARTASLASTEPASRAAIHDEERQRLARDIHDCLGQQVTAIRLSLDALAADASATLPYAARIAKTQQLAEELDRSLDKLTKRLRPPALDRIDFPAALNRLVSDWSEQFGIPAECDVPSAASIQLERSAASHLCRLVQEALHNVVKHAHATCVSVSFVCHDGEYVLLVEDDGRGFNVSDVIASDAPRGFGLNSMRERAALAGGELEIESSPLRGTTIVARVPSWSALRPAN
jgi:signal transduction histidine kinase